MTESFDYLFTFLEKESVFVDKTEFLFQLRSHPDYPTLLAVTDTLSFFNIKNGAMRVNFADLKLLPDRFVTMLHTDNTTLELSFVEKIDTVFFITKGKKYVEISLLDLQKRWNGIVLIIEKPEFENETASRNKLVWVLPLILLFIFIFFILKFKVTFYSKILLVLPLLGFLFSVVALKELFSVKSELFNKLCTISTKTSCETIVESKKWKIFKFANFSDLAIVFFSFQIVGWFIFTLLGQTNIFLSLIQVSLFCCLPFILLSLYFQKIVEKKWCPICLLIISIILLELIYLYTFIAFSFVSNTQTFFLFGFLVLSVFISWLTIKKLLIQNKELKEHQFKSNRFIRNYQIFKSSLLTNKKIEIIKSPIIFGNLKSETVISIVTNPFCRYCKDAHDVLDKILEKYNEIIQIQIIFKVDIENETDSSKHFFDSLLSIYFANGEIDFKKALSDWFKGKDINKWLSKYKTESNIENTKLIYKTQNDWCLSNRMTFTPAILVNGRLYPDSYDKENLEHFIKNLIEDNSI